VTTPERNGTTPGGKVVVAHPSRVSQADQIAAKEQIDKVLLRDLVPTTHVYILDLCPFDVGGVL
jgi:hypothetical protein